MTLSKEELRLALQIAAQVVKAKKQGFQIIRISADVQGNINADGVISKAMEYVNGFEMGEVCQNILRK